MYYPLEVLIKITIAAVLGGIVGWQREVRFRPAGLRTHILVCVGSAVYTLASMSFPGSSDPSRIASQVATGMGFLGAGTIIRHGNMVRGLTTAASLWAVAAIGICAAIGGRSYWVAGIATGVVLLTLTFLRTVEVRIIAHRRDALVTFRLSDPRSHLPQIQKALESEGVTTESVRVSASPQPGLEELEFDIRIPDEGDFGRIAAAVGRLEGFVSIRQD
jgi:putative Mg2+ transporter-C (MgtC) family protein